MCNIICLLLSEKRFVKRLFEATDCLKNIEADTGAHVEPSGISEKGNLDYIKILIPLFPKFAIMIFYYCKETLVILENKWMQKCGNFGAKKMQRTKEQQKV